MMRLPRILSVLHSLLVCIALAGSATASGAESASAIALAKDRALPTRVLFVGNSYLYYNDSLHNHVKRIVSELRPELAAKLQYKSATIGGARLKHHNIDWLLGAGQIGVDDAFEAVIMQGGSAEVLSAPSRDAFYQTVQAYADKVREIGAKPYLYMTHAYVPPHKRSRENMIEDIATAYLRAGQRAEAAVIPVGLAFDTSYRRRPDYSLHKTFDGTHPNLRGTYLAACVVVLSVYGGSLDALDYSYFGELSEADITYLQEVASQVVERFALPS